MQSKLHPRFSRGFSNSHLIADNSLIVTENPEFGRFRWETHRPLISESSQTSRLERANFPTICLTLLPNSVLNVLNDVHLHVQAYVICFCRQGDLLSQWRGYGTRQGTYSIGIDPSQVLQRNDDLRLVKVEYRPEKQIELTYKIIGEWIDVLVEKEVDTVPQIESALLDSVQLLLDGMFGHFFADLASSFKHPSFSEEDEYRLVYLRSPYRDEADARSLAVHFRARRGIVLPYVLFELGDGDGHESKSSITTIRIGPQPYPQLAQSGIQQLLAIKNLGAAISVESSNTPLRP